MSNTPRIAKKTEPRGQGLVEFALILPLLLLLTWGVIEFGRLLFIYTEVSNAAREAVRYGVARGRDTVCSPVAYADCEGIVGAAQSTTVLTSLDPDDPSTTIDIGYDHGGGSIFGVCDCVDPPDVHLGDRLVVTITHDIRPLILFRDTDSLQVTFTTARTIVEEGIPVPGQTDPGNEDPEGPLGESPSLDFVLDDPFACRGHLEWTAVSYADSYMTYRTLPIPTTELAANIVGLRYPATGTLQAEEGEEYAVRGFNEFGRGPLFGRDTVAGCNYPAYPELLELEFVLVDPDPCTGYFEWRTAPNADGYRLYNHEGDTVTEIDAPTELMVIRFPVDTTIPVTNGQIYVATAYNEFGEGLETPEMVSGCAVPPPAPADLAFYLDQATPPCQGYLRWDSVLGADTYRVYRDGAFLDSTDITRYPAHPDSFPVASGDVYAVTAFNNSGGESQPSNAVTASGCFVGPDPVDVTYYLHSMPSPPIWHSDAPPPLFMDEQLPGHAILYNYNGEDPTKPGREVLKGGGTPGSTSAEKFVEWRSSQQTVPLTLLSDVNLTLWGKNPVNQAVVATVSLYEMTGETGSEGYELISKTAYSWPANITEWQRMNVTLSATGTVIDVGNRLVVWVISDNAKSLHFAYDTTVYPSMIEFTGRWYE